MKFPGASAKRLLKSKPSEKFEFFSPARVAVEPRGCLLRQRLRCAFSLRPSARLVSVSRGPSRRHRTAHRRRSRREWLGSEEGVTPSSEEQSAASRVAQIAHYLSLRCDFQSRVRRSREAVLFIPALFRALPAYGRWKCPRLPHRPQTRQFKKISLRFSTAPRLSLDRAQAWPGPDALY